MLSEEGFGKHVWDCDRPEENEAQEAHCFHECKRASPEASNEEGDNGSDCRSNEVDDYECDGHMLIYLAPLPVRLPFNSEAEAHWCNMFAFVAYFLGALLRAAIAHGRPVVALPSL